MSGGRVLHLGWLRGARMALLPLAVCCCARMWGADASGAPASGKPAGVVLPDLPDIEPVTGDAARQSPEPQTVSPFTTPLPAEPAPATPAVPVAAPTPGAGKTAGQEEGIRIIEPPLGSTAVRPGAEGEKSVPSTSVPLPDESALPTADRENTLKHKQNAASVSRPASAPASAQAANTGGGIIVDHDPASGQMIPTVPSGAAAAVKKTETPEQARKKRLRNIDWGVRDQEEPENMSGQKTSKSARDIQEKVPGLSEPEVSLPSNTDLLRTPFPSSGGGAARQAPVPSAGQEDGVSPAVRSTATATRRPVEPLQMSGALPEAPELDGPVTVDQSDGVSKPAARATAAQVKQKNTARIDRTAGGLPDTLDEESERSARQPVSVAPTAGNAKGGSVAPARPLQRLPEREPDVDMPEDLPAALPTRKTAPIPSASTVLAAPVATPLPMDGALPAEPVISPRAASPEAAPALKPEKQAGAEHLPGAGLSDQDFANKLKSATQAAGSAPAAGGAGEDDLGELSRKMRAVGSVAPKAPVAAPVAAPAPQTPVAAPAPVPAPVAESAPAAAESDSLLPAGLPEPPPLPANLPDVPPAK